MSVLRLVVIFALLAVAPACRSRTPVLAPGSGLASVDREAPPGATLIGRPEFTAGDWFAYRRGGRHRLRYRVVTDPDGSGYLLVDEDADRALVLDRDLAQLGEGSTPRENGLVEWNVRKDPLDPSYTWPLWVGKRWSGDFVRRGADGTQLPFKTFYRVVATEQVVTPAGTFDTLRIERHASPATEGDFPDRVSLHWYAPEVGFLVRSLEDGFETELEEFHRQ